MAARAFRGKIRDRRTHRDAAAMIASPPPTAPALDSGAPLRGARLYEVADRNSGLCSSPALVRWRKPWAKWGGSPTGWQWSRAASADPPEAGSHPS